MTVYDQTGNGRHITQATGGSQPDVRLGVINGNPAMEFDGVADVIAGVITAAATRTIYLPVLKRTAPGTASRTALALGGNSQLYTDSDSGTGYFWFSNQAVGEAPIGGSPINSIVIVMKFVSAAAVTPYIGIVAGTGFDPNNEFSTSTTINLGAQVAGSNRGDYDIPGALVYNVTHSDADRTIMTNALQAYYSETFTRISQTLRYSGAVPDWFGRSSLVANGSTWVHVYRTGLTHGYDLTSRLHIRFSTDEGATWTAEDTFTDAGAVTGFPIAPHLTNGVAEGQMVVAPNGDLLIVALEIDAGGLNGSYVFRSTDAGKTWTDQGEINADNDLGAAMEFSVIGSEIYMAGWKQVTTHKSVLYKSADNGATWALVADVTSFAQDTDEWSFVRTSGNNMVGLLRDHPLAKTYKAVSGDLGLNWTVTDVTDIFGVITRPRLKIFPSQPNRIYLLSTDVIEGVSGFTCTRYSDDGGATWTPRFGLDVVLHTDWGYGDVLRLADGSFYAFADFGTTSVCSIYEYRYSVNN